MGCLCTVLPANARSENLDEELAMKGANGVPHYEGMGHLDAQTQSRTQAKLVDLEKDMKEW